MAEELNLHSLSPAQPRKDRKRVGRGMGSGKGRYSGRGIKGQKSRSGSHKMPAGFEGGQMPIDMRLPKLRGNTSADAMPIGPFRTSTQPVNLRDLEARFDVGAEVTPDALVTVGLIKNTKTDIKILGSGELTKKLSVTAHGFSKTAREKIEAAGGTVSWLRGEPIEKKPKRSKKKRPVVNDETAVEIAEEATPAAAEEATAGGEPVEKKPKRSKAKSPVASDETAAEIAEEATPAAAGEAATSKGEAPASKGEAPAPQGEAPTSNGEAPAE